MGKRVEYNNPAVTQIFDDLEQFLEFCRDFGYTYSEEQLYSNKSNSWRQFQKYQSGKLLRNQWDEDTRRFSGA